VLSQKLYPNEEISAFGSISKFVMARPRIYNVPYDCIKRRKDVLNWLFMIKVRKKRLEYGWNKDESLRKFSSVDTRYADDIQIGKNFDFIRGYKIQFKGRLSKKLRASKLIAQCGIVPLNTYSIDIDYSHFTVALKNSACTIKV
jgi:hypothetical protein